MSKSLSNSNHRSTVFPGKAEQREKRSEKEEGTRGEMKKPHSNSQTLYANGPNGGQHDQKYRNIGK